jgi:cell division septation protein DedD
MKRNKRKPQEFKKPFLVLNRRKLAGWVVLIFFSWACMFVVGVLVGRDTAPIKFDLKKLQQTQADSEQKKKAENKGITPGDPGVVKDKTKLGFYERLPEDQKDTAVPELKKQPGDNQKTKPAIQPKASASISKKPAPKTAAKKVQPQKPAPKTKKKEQKKVSTADTKKPTAPTGPVYTVQAASFKKAKDADQLVARLKQKGFPAYRTLGKVPQKGIWFRIRIGKYNSRAEAKKTLNKLKKLGLKPIIVVKQQ